MTSDHEHPFDEAVRNLPRYELPADVEAEHLRMLAELASQEPTRRRARLRAAAPRHRAAVIAASVVVLFGVGAGTAAALGVFSAEPTDRRIAVCYATASLDQDDNHLDVIVANDAGDDPSERDAASSAIDICAGGWHQGRLTSTPPYTSEEPMAAPWDREVPLLVACVLSTGQVGVFPGSTYTCTALGLPIAEL